MPGASAVEFLELFSQISPRVPVVIITGYPGDPMVKVALKKPRMCLTKPLTESDVKSLLEDFGVPYYKTPTNGDSTMVLGKN